MKKNKIDKTKLKTNTKNIFQEFKAFITKGNVIDLAVGVIIGGAFGAIVTAFVNILMSLCTWAVPGGISSLITVLPAINDGQAGIVGIGQTFTSDVLEEMVGIYAKSIGTELTAENFAALQSALLGKYTIHGGIYVWNSASIIDWGAIINAAFSFLIIAIVLFSIVKITSMLHNYRLKMEAKAQEEYYIKHPDKRPAPVEEGPKEPSDHEILKDILNELKKTNDKDTKKAS